jgi:hypothetical protein
VEEEPVSVVSVLEECAVPSRCDLIDLVVLDLVRPRADLVDLSVGARAEWVDFRCFLDGRFFCTTICIRPNSSVEFSSVWVRKEMGS